MHLQLVQFLSDMDKEGAAMSKVVVEAFKMIVPTFKGYSVYCKDYQPANEMFKDKMTNASGTLHRNSDSTKRVVDSDE